MSIEGILGRKLGMTQVFREDGTSVPVTVIEAGPCTVVQVKTDEDDGYAAVQLGFGTRKRVNSPLKGHMKGLGQFRYLREFPVDDIGEWEVGKKVGCELFQQGDLVHVSGASKGRGFAGVMKRHGFHGGPRTHGQSDRARAPRLHRRRDGPRPRHQGAQDGRAHGHGAGHGQEPAGPPI